MLTIRKANPDDARNLALLAETTFRTTFGAANTIEHMDLFCKSSYSTQIQAEEIANPDMITLLCEHEDVLVGYAQLRWSPPPGCVTASSPGEIQRLYVNDNWHGKGVAQGLMNECIHEIEMRGADAVWLGVWELNPRAIAFYNKSGFVEVGDHVFVLGGDPQRDIIMVKALASKSCT